MKNQQKLIISNKNK